MYFPYVRTTMVMNDNYAIISIPVLNEWAQGYHNNPCIKKIQTSKLIKYIACLHHNISYYI